MDELPLLKLETLRIQFTPEDDQLVELDSLIAILSSVQNEYKSLINNNKSYYKKEDSLKIAELKKGSFIAELITISQLSMPLISSTSLQLFIEYFDSLLAHFSSNSFKPKLDLPVGLSNCKNVITFSNACIGGDVHVNYIVNGVKDNENDIKLDSQ